MSAQIPARLPALKGSTPVKSSSSSAPAGANNNAAATMSSPIRRMHMHGSLAASASAGTLLLSPSQQQQQRRQQQQQQQQPQQQQQQQQSASVSSSAAKATTNRHHHNADYYNAASPKRRQPQQSLTPQQIQQQHNLVVALRNNVRAASEGRLPINTGSHSSHAPDGSGISAPAPKTKRVQAAGSGLGGGRSRINADLARSRGELSSSVSLAPAASTMAPSKSATAAAAAAGGDTADDVWRRLEAVTREKDGLQFEMDIIRRVSNQRSHIDQDYNMLASRLATTTHTLGRFKSEYNVLITQSRELKHSNEEYKIALQMLTENHSRVLAQRDELATEREAWMTRVAMMEDQIVAEKATSADARHKIAILQSELARAQDESQKLFTINAKFHLENDDVRREVARGRQSLRTLQQGLLKVRRERSVLAENKSTIDDKYERAQARQAQNAKEAEILRQQNEQLQSDIRDLTARNVQYQKQQQVSTALHAGCGPTIMELRNRIASLVAMSESAGRDTQDRLRQAEHRATKMMKDNDEYRIELKALRAATAEHDEAMIRVVSERDRAMAQVATYSKHLQALKSGSITLHGRALSSPRAASGIGDGRMPSPPSSALGGMRPSSTGSSGVGGSTGSDTAGGSDGGSSANVANPSDGGAAAVAAAVSLKSASSGASRRMSGAGAGMLHNAPPLSPRIGDGGSVVGSQRGGSSFSGARRASVSEVAGGSALLAATLQLQAGEGTAIEAAQRAAAPDGIDAGRPVRRMRSASQPDIDTHSFDAAAYLKQQQQHQSSPSSSSTARTSASRSTQRRCSTTSLSPPTGFTAFASLADAQSVWSGQQQSGTALSLMIPAESPKASHMRSESRDGNSGGPLSPRNDFATAQLDDARRLAKEQATALAAALADAKEARHAHAVSEAAAALVRQEVESLRQALTQNRTDHDALASELGKMTPLLLKAGAQVQAQIRESHRLERELSGAVVESGPFIALTTQSHQLSSELVALQTKYERDIGALHTAAAKSARETSALRQYIETLQATLTRAGLQVMDMDLVDDVHGDGGNGDDSDGGGGDGNSDNGGSGSDASDSSEDGIFIEKRSKSPPAPPAAVNDATTTPAAVPDSNGVEGVDTSDGIAAVGAADSGGNVEDDAVVLVEAAGGDAADATVAAVVDADADANADADAGVAAVASAAAAAIDDTGVTQPEMSTTEATHIPLSSFGRGDITDSPHHRVRHVDVDITPISTPGTESVSFPSVWGAPPG